MRNNDPLSGIQGCQRCGEREATCIPDEEWICTECADEEEEYATDNQTDD